MKLIIDISKATQKIIHDHGEVGIHMSAEKLLKAIIDGIPLDKHDEEIVATTIESVWGKPQYMELLDKIKDEINQYGSIWVQYAIKGHTDKDIENIVEDVLRQAKLQVLDLIDKYRK